MSELRVLSGPGAGQRIDASGGLVIGREEGVDLGGDPELSRRHARIGPGAGGELVVEDLGSTNGTLVNGQRIAAPTALRPGDRIELGGTVLEVAGQAAPAGGVPAGIGDQPTRAGVPAVSPAAPQRPPRPGTGPAPAAAAGPLPSGLAPAHPATKKGGGGSKAPFVVLGVVLGLLIGGGVAYAVWGGDDDTATSETASAGEGAFDGTLYTLSNGFAPRYRNTVLAYRTSKGSLLPMRLREYSTGGTSVHEHDLNLAVDGEQELNHDPERDLMFAVNPGSDTIAVFKVADDGSLTPVEGSPFKSGGIAPISTRIAGDTLLVANKGFDGVREVREEVAAVTQLRIGDDGALTPIGKPIALPSDTNPTQVLVARSGNLAVVSLLRGDEYFTLARQDDGTFASSEPAPITDRQRAMGGPGGPPDGGGAPPPGQGGGGPPSGPDGGGPPGGAPPGGGQLGEVPLGALGMTEHPKAPVIYSGLPNFSLLMVHEYDEGGRLRFVRGVRVPQGFLVCWTKVTADGRFLYTSNTGENTISVFDVLDPRNPRHLQSHEAPKPGAVASIYLDEEADTLYALDRFDPVSLEPGQSNRLVPFKIGPDGRVSGGQEGSVRLPIAAEVAPMGMLWLPRRDGDS